MQKIFKKATAAFAAFACLVPFTANTVNANATTYYLGDANGNNTVSASDLVFMEQYLMGYIKPTQKQITNMDVNQDYIIDKADIDVVTSMVSAHISHGATTDTLYDLPNNDPRTYKRYIYNSPNTQPYQYTLTEGNEVNANIMQELEEIEFLNGDSLNAIDNPDHENSNVVAVRAANTLYSGVVIGNHVIATCAEAVINYSSETLKNNIYVDIYDEYGDTVEYTFSPQYVHIPVDYIDSSTTDAERKYYNYALIYVPQNLANYGVTKWDVGTIIDEFNEENSIITTSGFKAVNGSTVRYYSEGHIQDLLLSTENDYKYNIKSNGPNDGKPGGALYYEYSVGNDTYKTLIGIVGRDFSNLSENTWAVRLTPDVLRFFICNNEITP